MLLMLASFSVYLQKYTCRCCNKKAKNILIIFILFVHRRDLFQRVFEMDHAYIVPTLDSNQTSSPDQLPWKQQFAIMVCMLT